MVAIQRSGTGVWRGDLRKGDGEVETASGALDGAPYSYGTRFEQAQGTNPEELIAAAHAACFSMAFAKHLSQQGHRPEEIRTEATVTLEDGRINAMRLRTRGRVEGLDEDAFARLAEEAERSCPVSNLLRQGLAITIEARLVEE